MLNKHLLTWIVFSLVIFYIFYIINILEEKSVE